MKKSTVALLFLAFIILGVCVFPKDKALASGATITFKTEKEEVEIGELITVYMVISSETTIGDYEGYISYDSDILEFKSGSSAITGGGGVLKISDINAMASEGTRTYTVKFLALEKGSCQVSVFSQPMVYEYYTGLAMSVSSKSLTVAVKPSSQASSNSRLSSLLLSTGTLVPAFDPAIMNYSVSVGDAVENIIISASAEDIGKAVVKGGGLIKLEKGDNEIKILVTAEAGNVSEYRINIYRKDAAPTPTPTPIPTPTKEADKEEEEKKEWFVDAGTENGTKFLFGAYKYEICQDETILEIPKGFKKTKIQIGTVPITAYAPENSTESDFLLLALQKEGGEPGWYRYDRLEKTIQRFWSEDITISVDKTDLQEQLNEELKAEYEQQISGMQFLIYALAALCVIMLMAVITAFLRARSKDELD